MKCYHLHNSSRAEMGMGTLIIFIAMVLVASVAAGVLISTTSSLQNKALSTAKATTAEIGTSLNVVQVYAEDGNNGNVEEIISVIKLTSGSDPMRFEDLLMAVNLMNETSDYMYDPDIDCNNQSHTIAGGDYGVSYIINGSNNRNGYLTKGDVTRLCFETSRSVSESETLIIGFVPKVGAPRIIETDLPDLFIDKRVTLFP